MIRGLVTSLIFLICASAAGVGGSYYLLRGYGNASQIIPGTQTIVLEPGESLAALAVDLANHQVVDRALYFRLWARFFSQFARFQAGTYRFEGVLSPHEVAAEFIAGKVFRAVFVTVAIPEGYNLRQIGDKLEAANIGTRAEFLRLTRDPTVIRSVGLSTKTLEGYIYPATYPYFSMPTVNDFIVDTIATFKQNMPANYEADLAKMGLTLNQGLTLASLIELETADDSERFLISEVIWRRYRDGGPLGIDAALIYGIKDYAGDIRWKDLQDRKNPYNTRIFRGLPPTPIGSPSRLSMEAVLSPANDGNYYYVVDVSTPLPHKHKFSKTLADHQRYVRLLIDQSKLKSEKHRPDKTRGTE